MDYSINSSDRMKIRVTGYIGLSNVVLLVQNYEVTAQDIIRYD